MKAKSRNQNIKRGNTQSMGSPPVRTVRVDDETWANLQTAAEIEGKSTSELLRELLEEGSQDRLAKAGFLWLAFYSIAATLALFAAIVLTVNP